MSKKINQTFREGGIVHFGERLKQAMNGESNLSFAKKCGLSETVIRNYLSGKSFPGIDKLPVLAAATGKSIEWLVTGNDVEADSSQLATKEELEQWWHLIMRSFTSSELMSIIRTFQNSGKKGLFDLNESEPKIPTGLSQSSINTAMILEALPEAERREILARYGINEQAGPVAAKEAPHKKAG